MSNGARIDLLLNGSGSGDAKVWPGGKGLFMVAATFGGGNVKLQIISPNAMWTNITDGTLTADGSVVFDLPSGEIRARATTATAVYAYAVTIP